jgi:hypothetical protein
MSTFWIYLQLGLHHVLDWKGYDHLLFLAALTVPFLFKDWKKVLALISIFTIGHTLSLMLAVFGVLMIRTDLVELLIPCTIFITAVYGLFTAGKPKKPDGVGAAAVITLFFGIVHGLGFSNYFSVILSGKPGDKLLPLLEFALGIECAQAIIVLIVLAMAYICQHFFRLSRRDWTIAASALIAGVSIPMILGDSLLR